MFALDYFSPWLGSLRPAAGPARVELVLARPLVSTAMVQKELDVSRQGAVGLVGELNLREITGRKRYQGWGIT